MSRMWLLKNSHEAGRLREGPQRSLGAIYGGVTRALLFATLYLLAALGASAQEPAAAAQAQPAPAQAQPADTENIKLFRMQSELLTSFWGRPMFIEAGVLIPPGWTKDERLPVSYSTHGFGGSHRMAWRFGPSILEKMKAGDYPRIIVVFLNAQFPLGHHVFVDSVNNGPWGKALTKEFIPAIEKEFGAFGAPEGRFLEGHSSGGWTALWLQVEYPEFFGGTWPSSPDPVDFRDCIGVNIYEWKSFYTTPDGAEIPFVRRGDEWASTIGTYGREEAAKSDYGGQLASLDAVFSPRAEDGRPMKLFNRETGEIDPEVAQAWKKYDISIIIRENWRELGPKLAGKIHLFCGTKDTFRLNDSLKLLEQEMKALGSDASFVWVEGRGHGIAGPHFELWPEGLQTRIHREMWAKFESSAKNEAAAVGAAN